MEEVVNDASCKYSKGTDCLAFYSEDQVWYRAIVEEVFDDNCQVMFSDYGNTDIVDWKHVVTAVEELSEDQLSRVDPLIWRVGMQCIAKWSEDNTWYNVVGLSN